MPHETSILKVDDPIPGQNWACISIVSPTSRQKADTFAIKIRGVSDSLDDAKRLAETLRNRDDTFDVYVAKVGAWLPLIFNEDDITERQYTNDVLTQIISERYKQREKSDMAFEERRVKALAQNAIDNSPEGIRKRNEQAETAVSVWYKIRQLEEILAVRQEELKALREKFDGYSEFERSEAHDTTLPEINISPAGFVGIPVAPGDETQDASQTSS